jgi:hypothetical protein
LTLSPKRNPADAVDRVRIQAMGVPDRAATRRVGQPRLSSGTKSRCVAPV